VDGLTGGRVAYIYLPDAGSAGFAAFNRYFFAQADREAVIVDARFSTGGVLPDYFVERLGQQALTLVGTREGRGFSTPYSIIRGPKVLIANEFSACSGDVLAYFFRRAGLGPLVGTRTEGKLFGPNTLTLMDGGSVLVPANALYTPEGQWLGENEGIAPDIEVEQDPAAVRTGHDPQLEKAVEVIMAELEKNPVPRPKRPPYPRYQRTNGLNSPGRE
jgi:tricorn protease